MKVRCSPALHQAVVLSSIFMYKWNSIFSFIFCVRYIRSWHWWGNEFNTFICSLHSFARSKGCGIFLCFHLFFFLLAQWVMWETWYVCVDCGMNATYNFIRIRLLFPSSGFFLASVGSFANWHCFISANKCIVWNVLNLRMIYIRASICDLSMRMEDFRIF